MNGSKLAIFKVFTEQALEEVLCCQTAGYDLLILCSFAATDKSPSPLPGRSILYFGTDYAPGVISKLAFSYAVDRDYQIIAGIFDWNSISLSEISTFQAKMPNMGMILFPTNGAETGFIPSLIRYFSGLPKEFFTSYSCKGIFSGEMLKQIPFKQNLSKNFFDTELFYQIRAGGFEVRVDKDKLLPAKEENGAPSNLQLFKLALTLKLQRLGIFYDPRFDLVQENQQYEAKFDFVSSHSLALSKITSEDSLLILGSGPKELVQPFSSISRSVVAVDSYVDSDLRNMCDFALQADLENVFNYDEISPNLKYTKVIALDIIEHLRSPEEFLNRIRSSNSTAGSRVLITTPNIAFLPIRAMLLFGFFNYGKRGILDRTHTRLFTISSLRRVLKQSGFDVEEIRGIPAPIPLAVGRGALGNFLLKLNMLMINIWPSLFSFQILAVARALPTVEQLLLETQNFEKRASR